VGEEREKREREREALANLIDTIYDRRPVKID
jgi:hypothetical protein